MVLPAPAPAAAEVTVLFTGVFEGVREEVGFPRESTDLPWARTAELGRRERPALSSESASASASPRREVEEPRRSSEGRTSFFCLEAGRISSRSTGTPKETRKRRRMRERIQSGGWSGGGATSWDQREAERGCWKMGSLTPLVDWETLRVGMGKGLSESELSPSPSWSGEGGKRALR